MTRVVLTYREYAALPDDGRWYEIHDGELSVTPAPGVKSRGLGLVLYAPLDVILSDTTIVQPDIVYVATGRLGQITDRGIEGPPTLVVEILSPSTSETDRHTKLEVYARHRIPYYWIVD